MTNSEIEPFPSYSPSQRTNIYNIILINYRWDGELMLERGLRPLSNYFPFPVTVQSGIRHGNGVEMKLNVPFYPIRTPSGK